MIPPLATSAIIAIDCDTCQAIFLHYVDRIMRNTERLSTFENTHSYVVSPIRCFSFMPGYAVPLHAIQPIRCFCRDGVHLVRGGCHAARPCGAAVCKVGCMHM